MAGSIITLGGDDDDPAGEGIPDGYEIYDATGRLIGKSDAGRLPRGIYFGVERKGGRPVSARVFVQ